MVHNARIAGSGNSLYAGPFLRALACSLVFALANPVPAKSEPANLCYVITPAMEGNLRRLHVTLSFEGAASGKSRLVLPSEWGGQADLHKAIRELLPASPETEILSTNEPNIKIIKHLPGKTIQVTYDVARDWEGDLKDGLYYRTVLQPTYFYGEGEALWVYPEWSQTEPITISLEWRDVPKDWIISNSFGTNRTRQEFRSTLEAFRHGTFIGGDYRIKRILIEGEAMYIAVRDRLMFTDDDFSTVVEKIMRIERGFWKDNGFQDFLVVLLPTADPEGNVGGQSRTNSLSLYVPKTRKTPSDFINTIAHELFHSWNPNRLGGLQNENLYWFSEGFTDYYASLLLLRGGLVSLEEYVGGYNGLLKAYHTSPVRTLTNQEVTRDRRVNYDAERLPYQRGCLLAQRWDVAIRAATNGQRSLDNVMLDLLVAAEKKGFELSEKRLAEVLQPYLKDTATRDIERYMNKGEVLPVTEDVFGSFAVVSILTFSPFDLGFDVEKTHATRVFTGVVKDSAAYRAGLRDGQKWIGGGAVADATVQAEFTVQEGDVQKVIKYYPAGNEQIRVPQYQLKAGLSQEGRARCLALLGVPSLASRPTPCLASLSTEAPRNLKRSFFLRHRSDRSRFCRCGWPSCKRSSGLAPVPVGKLGR